MSLKYQTNQDWDIFILDDQSGTPWQNYYFLVYLINNLKLDGHIIEIDRSPYPYGVSNMRQFLADKSIKRGYEFILRLDDDSHLAPDYIERLMKVIEKGYDLATGVVPATGASSIKRDPKFISNKIVNRVILDDQGNYILNNDDCGTPYLESVILPAHHFRSCCLYKTELHKNGVNYTPTRLSKHGFREEQIFSYKALMKGYKLGCDTGAIAWHLMTPSGGERFADSNELIQLNEMVLREFTKENKEELNKIFTRENMPSNEELLKETNLARIQ